MKRYPLHTLLRLREHRTDAARQVVLQKQRAVQACRDACTRIEQEIVQLGSERAGQRARLLDAPPPGVDWSSVLAQRESHIDWLGGQIERSEEHTSELQSLMCISYAVFCLKKKIRRQK